MLDTIREEEKKRLNDPHEDTLSALDQWADIDQPFISEMVLLLLVGVWHGIERELVLLAAGHSDDPRKLEADDYWDRIKEARRRFDDHKKRNEFTREFKLDALPEWRSIEALRNLANSYKHNPFQKPNSKLLEHLGLDEVPVKEPLQLVYAGLPESILFRQHFAEWLGLPSDTTYCSIASVILDRVDRFVDGATKAIPRNIPFPRVSLSRFES